MVEELELTDQDVTTIAGMIDSEIRYHIPSWNFSETPVDFTKGIWWKLSISTYDFNLV